MNEFDLKARGWDLDPMHLERSMAVTSMIREKINLDKTMKALEFGAGTGITSFLLQDSLGEIIMMDSSAEMVRVMNEKVSHNGSGNLMPLLFDLENSTWSGDKFNIIISQMVLHHVSDIAGILSKFHDMLTANGFLAIADLYTEDGSFHGTGFTGHKGFDPENLKSVLMNLGYSNVEYQKCFVISKKIAENKIKNFDIFLLIATKQ